MTGGILNILNKLQKKELFGVKEKYRQFFVSILKSQHDTNLDGTSYNHQQSSSSYSCFRRGPRHQPESLLSWWHVNNNNNIAAPSLFLWGFINSVMPACNRHSHCLCLPSPARRHLKQTTHESFISITAGEAHAPITLQHSYDTLVNKKRFWQEIPTMARWSTLKGSISSPKWCAYNRPQTNRSPQSKPTKSRRDRPLYHVNTRTRTVWNWGWFIFSSFFMSLYTLVRVSGFLFYRRPLRHRLSMTRILIVHDAVGLF